LRKKREVFREKKKQQNGEKDSCDPFLPRGEDSLSNMNDLQGPWQRGIKDNKGPWGKQTNQNNLEQWDWIKKMNFRKNCKQTGERLEFDVEKDSSPRGPL